MKQYKMYRHPDRGLEAVKIGWSWPGFFFGPFWALSKGLVLIGCGSWLGIFIVAAMIGSASGARPDAAVPIFNFVGIVAAFLFGAGGNSLRERTLTSKGYKLSGEINANTPAEAISLYLSSVKAGDGSTVIKQDSHPGGIKQHAPDGKVKFFNKKSHSGGTYEEYKCDDAEEAKKFLLNKTVDKEQYYIVVETPEGGWGIDIKGLYKEKLLSWQTDLTKAETEGSTWGIPPDFSLSMAALGAVDNFVSEVSCGNCKHIWKEGLRYQNWTVVKCPACQKLNKVSSHNFHYHFVR